MPARQLIVVLGDQLSLDSSALAAADPRRDVVWMAEVPAEARHVWSHKARIVLFLSAMRHFAEELRQQGWQVDYRGLDQPDNRGDFAGELQAAIGRWQPDRVLLVEPGEWRVRRLFEQAAAASRTELSILPDGHFLCTRDEFARHAEGRKQLRQEFFYRELRKRTGILMRDGQPLGGKWNYDAENRGSFGKSGPRDVPAPRRFAPDQLTRQVIQLVEQRFADHPGRLKHFDWPVTRRQAEQALEDFIQQRLPWFGQYQDAMWTGQPWLYHSRLSAALNLKLLDPRDVLRAAEAAWHGGAAPLAAVEGFVRQILGWREYVRGVYWLLMPEYLERNALDAQQPLPDFYWTGQTEMNCLREALHQTLDLGYAHHIQRLMITGLYALLLGVRPRAVHEWYLAVYVDAVEWVELPNTLGMSQYADGGVMASKPYVATGKYIQRMSNYCAGCRFDPAVASGPRACPFTTLYWDFLLRHRPLLAANQRMALQVKNLDRKRPDELLAIQQQAARWKAGG
ncbi:MAG: cryptochrome/photolyase family protein [Pirellulaceae bacterium]|nr:cryptochrome/photolyase family protein [Pirellulaceae bacterium]